MVEKRSKKKILLIILTLIIIGVIVLLAPIIYMFGGIFIEMIFNKPSKPITKYAEFPFEIKYEYEGENGIIKDTIICEYEGTSFSLDGGNKRDWNCYFKNNKENGHYYIDKENNSNLYIYVPIDAEYYMGAPDSNIENARPYIDYDAYAENTVEDNVTEEIVVVEDNLTEEIILIENEDPREKTDIKILEWIPSEPLKNNFN